MQPLIPLLFFFLGFLKSTIVFAEAKIYGVNLGSWLVLEPWMVPEEWTRMGGQLCQKDCSACICSEFAFAAAYPDTVDGKFAEHWSTWFTQDDVNILKGAGINTVRIPLGYWIVEPLVDRNTESYPVVVSSFYGLKMLRDANIQAILVHHALPGVQTPDQMFTGQYTDYNYGRALTWTAVMTFLSHLHPNFESVFAIEAVNEPIANADQTPGYGDFQKNFVKTVRAVELLFGIQVEGYPALQGIPNNADMSARLKKASTVDNSGLFDPESVVGKALTEAAFILPDIILQLNWLVDFGACQGCTSLTTRLFFSLLHLSSESYDGAISSFMDILWQHNNPENPANAAIGPQAYDHHIYYKLEVAAPNPEAYLHDICTRNDFQRDAAMGNPIVWVGEWSLATRFNATDDFLSKWADAQKLTYNQSAGWLFWNFKIEPTSSYARQWSYMEGLNRGYLTIDPSQFHDPNVCAPYRNISSTRVRARLRASRLTRSVTIPLPFIWNGHSCWEAYWWLLWLRISFFLDNLGVRINYYSLVVLYKSASIIPFITASVLRETERTKLLGERRR
ncbi:glycoside hydrolase superfamily [Lactifluus volemus]|nr:glycoside hydrolase superfamily [Lactifluus volemus]